MENQLERHETKLHTYFSLEDEVQRVKYSLDKLGWFTSKGYQVTLPRGAEKEDPTQATERDFDVSLYEQKEKEIGEQWEKMSGHFFEKMKSFNLLIQESYDLYLTRYGVGGSYRPPNTIIINFNYPMYTKIESIMTILFHEIIHLAIEEWIREYNIPHWTKERLVDLTYNKIFDEKVKLQTDPENFERVERVFNSYFPDMKRVIVELTNKEQ